MSEQTRLMVMTLGHRSCLRIRGDTQGRSVVGRSAERATPRRDGQDELLELRPMRKRINVLRAFTRAAETSRSYGRRSGSSAGCPAGDPGVRW
jgi:hypothetical protein